MDESKNKRIGMWVTALLVIVALSLIPWAFAAYVSLFAFDAPGSEKELSTWLMVAPVWAYPVIAAGCITGSIILRRKNKLLPALIMLIIPLAAVVIWAIFMGIYFGIQAR
jgi:hypothetical protein